MILVQELLLFVFFFFNFKFKVFYSLLAEVDCYNKSQIPLGFMLKLHNCYILAEEEDNT